MKNEKHSEAKRLLAKGFKLCELHHMSKRPVGDGWQLNPVKAVDDDASGYGLPLAINGLCSIDPDNVEPAREGLARCGFDLEELMNAGVRTSSTRPGSGGRSTFKAPPGLGRVVFSSKRHGTILELRSGQSNLQDCLPGTTYKGKDGDGPYIQEYANDKTLDEAPELPIKFLAWWRRMDDDIEFKREQQALLSGQDAVLSVSGGAEGGDIKLAFASGYRTEYNATHDVEDILARHGYTQGENGRWAPSTATGAPCVRVIPGKTDLWQSDHASDPLCGTFDAWTAHVMLDHDGNLAKAEKAYEPEHHAMVADEFDILPTVCETTGEDLDWPKFSRNKNGGINKNIDNALLAANSPGFSGIRIGYDTFRDELMLAEAGTDDWRPFQDDDYTWLRQRWLNRGFVSDVGRELIRDVVFAIGKYNAFDSAQLWISKLQWDGVPRVEKFFSHYFNAPDTEYIRAVSRYSWTAMAGRVMEPGVQADMVPILVGNQGARKTSAIARMVPSTEFFCEINFHSSETDLTRVMKGCLVGEIGELRGLHTKDLNSIKSFITRREEKWVPKFKEFASAYKRRIVFFGTTNDHEFLDDPTGNRRWLPFHVGDEVDVEGIVADRDQLWAEAAVLFMCDGVHWQDAQRLGRAEHCAFEMSDDWAEPVSRWLDTPDEFEGPTPATRGHLTSAEILIGALGFDVKSISRMHQMRLVKVMKSLGYTRKNLRVNGIQTKVYAKEEKTLP